MKNPIKRVKAWIYGLIAKAVRRELGVIFRKYGSVAVDHHLKSRSWAVIKVDVDDTCYLKFLDMDKVDLKHLQLFLRQFDRASVDSTPTIMKRLNNGIVKIADFDWI